MSHADARLFLELRDEGETVDDSCADEEGWSIARMAGSKVGRAAARIGIDEAWDLYSAAFRAAAGEP